MDYFNSLVGPLLGQRPSQVPVQSDEDSDFADFAGAPAPSPVSIPAAPSDAAFAQPTAGVGSAPVYTKWYRVWERTSLSDFKMEAILLPFILVAVLVHFWGTRSNKRRARKWVAAHAPLLDSEFALVGFHKQPKMTPYPEGVQSEGLVQAGAKLPGDNVRDDMIREKTAYEYETYATGRQNVAFIDFKITLNKWYNPGLMIAENIAGLVMESLKPSPEQMEAIMYTFDGREKDFVPPPVPGADRKPVSNSTYDPFILAIVNKNAMRRLRDARYDVSLTSTKDHARLPEWATVMSESAEVTDTVLTDNLIKAINAAGPDHFDYLIITDQPIDKPEKLNEIQSRKRLYLSMRLPYGDKYEHTLPLFQAFLRLPDHLVAQAKFRPEAMRKINATREAEKNKLKRVSDKEAEEDRLKSLEKLKKEERDRKLSKLSAEEQKKFLDQEQKRDLKKQQKRYQKKG